MKKQKETAIENVSLFSYKDTEINLLFRNGFLGYTFERDGKHYGQKMELKSRSVKDIADTTTLLVLNFIETLEAVEKIND